MSTPRFGASLIVASVAAVGVITIILAGAVLTAASSYPLDGYERTGIRRLRAYRMILDGEMPGNLSLPAGAQLPESAIRLGLADVNEAFDVGPSVPRDPQLQSGLERILRVRDPSYRAAIVDITDPTSPRYAAFKETQGYFPGSVGKILVMTGLFNELRKLYPTDFAARERVLRDTWIAADGFVVPNSHAVPVVAADWSGVVHRSVRVGDEFTLWEWVDHMVSPSSNAAGSMVWKHVILLNEFGRDYPPTPEQEAEFFRTTPKEELTERSIRLVEEPMLAAGLDTAQLRIRTFFTAGAQKVIPGRASHSTPGELVRWLIRLEQGRLVDRWSSREMKRLLYFTRRRYRYAVSSALRDAAVYFKSGSRYRCQPEEGYECVQYKGNKENLMHSVAIIETPASGETQRVYLVSMMSNVLKVNSANEHAEIAALIDRLVRDSAP